MDQRIKRAIEMLTLKRAAKKGMIANIIGLVIVIIVIVAVAIPVTTAVIADANLTGITATIVGFIPLFLALLGLATVAFAIQGK